VNDSLAGLLVAPLLFASLERYRADHFRHHLQLGTAGGDPDLMVPPDLLPRHWLRSYLLQVCSLQAWWGDFCGHLGAAGVPMSGRAYIVAWWLAALALMLEVAGAQFTSTFVGLWLLARATVFPPDHDTARDVRPLRPAAGRHPELHARHGRGWAVAPVDPSSQQRLPPDPSPAASRAVLPAAAGACAVPPLAGVPVAWHGLQRVLHWPDSGGAGLGAGGEAMTTRVLGALQVAALLVSASYGIGFLFGSGEMALTHSMAGGLYGVATALGMLALASFAGRLWKLGMPVWELFGRAFGPPIQRAVALLSLVWMSGVLAAQIAGGVAIAEVIGLPRDTWRRRRCWC
jgi:hypothetical protein